jgi:hypothetical protein
VWLPHEEGFISFPCVLFQEEWRWMKASMTDIKQFQPPYGPGVD